MSTEEEQIQLCLLPAVCRVSSLFRNVSSVALRSGLFMPIRPPCETKKYRQLLALVSATVHTVPFHMTKLRDLCNASERYRACVSNCFLPEIWMSVMSQRESLVQTVDLSAVLLWHVRCNQWEELKDGSFVLVLVFFIHRWGKGMCVWTKRGSATSRACRAVHRPLGVA